MPGDICVLGNVTTNKPGYGQSLSTGDESRHKAGGNSNKKSACPVNVVTTDIIKGSLCEFDHKRGEIGDNHPGREEIIKKRTEGAKAQQMSKSALEGQCAKSSMELVS